MFDNKAQATYITVPELARLLKVSRATIYNWLKIGLPSIKIANSRRFELHDVCAWLNTKKAAINSDFTNCYEHVKMPVIF